MVDKSIGNNLWSEEARSELLHILPQGTYHDQAEIRGSNVALRRLGEALIEASKKGQCQQVKVSMMAADGEGYQVVIQPMSDQQIDAGPMPYAQLGQDWEFIRNDTKSAHIVHNAPALIEAAKLVDQQLQDGGVTEHAHTRLAEALSRIQGASS